MKGKKNKSQLALLILAIILILCGSVIFLYPKISNYLAEKNHEEVIRNYQENVVKLDEENLSGQWEEALKYNENLSGEPVQDPFIPNSGYVLPENYTEVLNINEDGVMAYIEIPKISVYLPIYHGTSADILEKGVGHMQSTSLPIGGASTHCVLTGHTGLSSAELFTRIDELEIGDVFYIHVLDTVLEYKVYETKIVLPDQIDELQIISGRDLVTLVTCTPYGVNTHRLLVKAERTEYNPYEESILIEESEEKEENNNNIKYYLIGVLIAIIIFIIILVSIYILRIVKKGRN